MNHNLALINSLKARLGLDCMYSVSSSRPTVLICVRVSLALSQSSPVLISNQKYFFLEKIFVRIQIFYCCPHSVLNVSYTSHTRVKLSKKHFSQQKWPDLIMCRAGVSILLWKMLYSDDKNRIYAPDGKKLIYRFRRSLETNEHDWKINTKYKYFINSLHWHPPSCFRSSSILKHDIDSNLSRNWAGPAHVPQQQPSLAVRSVRRDLVLAQPAHGGQARARAGGQPPPRAKGVPARDFVHRDPVTVVADTNVEILITVRLVVRVDTQDPLLSLNRVSSPRSTPSPLLLAPLTFSANTYDHIFLLLSQPL